MGLGLPFPMEAIHSSDSSSAVSDKCLDAGWCLCWAKVTTLASSLPSPRLGSSCSCVYC